MRVRVRVRVRVEVEGEVEVQIWVGVTTKAITHARRLLWASWARRSSQPMK